MKAIISGGGTGGHIFPAIAIADALKVLSPDIDIHFVGALGKMEMDLVPKAGYTITGLPVSGFQRKITFQNLSLVYKLMKSLWKAYRILNTFKPNVAIGVGGYASGPTLQVAGWMGIPTMVQEQNSYAGATNRILGKKAERIFVAYEHMEKFFPGKSLLFLGNPIRNTIRLSGPDKKTSVQKLGLNPELKTVFVFGGSLGAKTLNEAIVEGFAKSGNPKDFNLIWQIGKHYWNQYSKSEPALQENVKVFAFVEDMSLVYSAADLVVCRAGALTISEIALLRKPAILVPSPNVAEDHQMANAKALVNKNAAILVKDVDAKKFLLPTIKEWIHEENKLNDLTKNIGFFAKPDAAIKIAEEILKYSSSDAEK